MPVTASNIIINFDQKVTKGVMPVVVSPSSTQHTRLDAQTFNQTIDDYLLTHGAILFRGFDVHGEHAFQQLCQLNEPELLTYEFGSTPRSVVAGKVYTTTEYPAHQTIPLHNEQAYTLHWPMKIWFHCITAPDAHGETPIADSKRIFETISKPIRDRFTQKELLYIRNYGGGLDVSWQDTFNTTDKAKVEAFCRQQNIVCEWKPNGELRTKQRCQGTMQHPITGQSLWFNQAHLFHISNVPKASRDVLLSIVSEADLPRNVYYGDGSPIESSILDEIRATLEENAIYFPWQAGDVLMLDNMRFAHGRNHFSGERRVVVAMANAMQNHALLA